MSRLLSGSVAPGFSAIPAPSAASGIRLVYADPRSRSLVLAFIEVGSGSEAPMESTVIDRIAEGADPSPEFGSHAYADLGDIEYLAYLDRAADGSLTLRQLRRARGAKSWAVDLLEPVGRPLALLADGDEVHLLRSDGGLIDERVSGSAREESVRLLEPFDPRGAVSLVRGSPRDLVTVYDASSGNVLVAHVERGKAVTSFLKRPAGTTFGAVSGARRDSSGALCLFYYDASSRSLLDLRDAEGEPKLVRVSKARDVTAVFAFSRGEYTGYLYAELAPDSSGHLTSTLTLLETRGNGLGGRAKRRTLSTSALPYTALQAYAASGELRIVALTGDLLLLRVGLTDGT